MKSRTIDLVQDCRRVAFVFEVKTDSKSLSIYTGIGQLSIRATSVAAYLGKRTNKVLVVPDAPQRWLAELIEKDLNIHIVTYTISSRHKVAFKGLDGLTATSRSRRK